MRIAHLAAGAGGMFCGSCLHDNALAKAMIRLGHEVALIPAYTPMRIDEESVSESRVVYGAVNVYLQQKVSLFRHTPRFLDWLLDRPWLLRWISSRFADTTDARELGDLTLSVLRGERGAQAKELDRLVHWLARDYRPEVVQITNSLLLGLAGRIRREVGVPVVVQVQGEDIFLDLLPNREQVLAEMRARTCDADLVIAPCRFYAQRMGELLELPAERLRVVPLGIDPEVHQGGGRPATPPAPGPTIGYLARICPEKGLHTLAEAFRIVAAAPGGENVRLAVAGWLGPRDRPYLSEIRARIEGWGLADRFDYFGEVDLDQKLAFLDSLDLLSVPTSYLEPKGLFVLEAFAHGVPVVQPRHGAFPELVEPHGAGLLVEPESPQSLAEGLLELLADPRRRAEMGRRGRDAVRGPLSDRAMAQGTVAVFEEALARHPAGGAAARIA
ncbi:MAG: glycosyltransferase family 4 protein [Thermoanaerobaculia bacterium]|nr:glycosyltransferase family 4 protein [Thermoanaerobaculia bacterium]